MSNTRIAIIDVDDVLGESVESFLPEINIRCHTSYVVEQITHWDFERSFPGYVTNEQAWQVFDDPTVLRRIRPKPLARNGLMYLRDREFTLVVSTSRKEIHYDVTKEWLFKQSFFHHHLFVGRKKDEVLSELMMRYDTKKAIAFEDNFLNASALAEAGAFVFLFDRPWNRSFSITENMRRISGWEGFFSLLQNDKGIESFL